MNTRTLVTTSLALATLASAPAMAAETTGARASKQETIGLGSGLVVGALAAGPVGALVGAATGALLGDRLHRDARSLEGLEQSLASERRRGHDLDARVASLQNELVLRERMLRELEEMTARIGDSLQFSVPFRTNAATLTPEATAGIERLGRVLAEIGDVEILVEGHTDARGDSRLNEALSAARAESVRAVLLSAGLAGAQVRSVAHGARYALAEEGDLDGYALDRRVEIRMMLGAESGRIARRD